VHKVHQTAQKVSNETKDTVTKLVTIKGVLTIAINNQWVMTTNVTLPGQETERWRALHKALNNMKQCKALYKTLGVKTNQQVPQLLMATEVTKLIQNFTHSLLTMKKSEELL
jgi:hypothetical protein